MDFMGEHRAVRDFAFTGTMIIFGGVLASHLLAAGIAEAPRQIATLTNKAHGASTPVLHDEVRSVLDDDITTGSISRGRIIHLDPCTGAEKALRP